MRYLLMAAISAVALGAAGPAAAQVYGAPIPAPGGQVYAQPYGAQVSVQPPYAAPGPQVPTAGPRVWQNGRWMALPPSQNIARQNDPNRWGYDNRGRWEAGSRAPGGWGAYRRLGRGHRMPQYWMGGSFWINDYLNFGLAAPPQGYRWMRYYDDAVLVDYQGQVWDSVGGIAWAGADAYAGGGHSNSSSYSYSSSGASIQPVDPDAYYQQQYPGGYAPPVAYAPPAAQYGSGYGGSYGSSYQQGSYYYGAPTGSTVSSVVIIPTTTTTTIVEEEIVEESVVTTSYVRAAPRRVVRRAAPKPRPYRPRPKPACCRCVCR